MENYKLVLGLLGAVIGVASYVPYIRDMLKQKTKPHPFSWFVWGLVSLVAFFAQIFSNGGIGAWATGVTAGSCLLVAVLAVFMGERRISKLDIVCLLGALLGIVVWVITKDPLNAVLIVLTVHILGFVPTVKKAYRFPHEETLINYVLSLFKWGFGLMALTSFNLTTVLFPVSVFIMNLGFSVMLIIRRRE